METRPGLCPIYLPGKEPLPPGWTEDDRAMVSAQKSGAQMFNHLTESCVAKATLSGVAGFALGGFFSLLSTSLTVDDPLRRSNLQAAAMARGESSASASASVPELTTAQQTKEFFKQTGRGMYRSAKGFGKVGLIYSGVECCIEGVSFVQGKETMACKKKRKTLTMMTVFLRRPIQRSTELRTIWSTPSQEVSSQALSSPGIQVLKVSWLELLALPLSRPLLICT